MRRTIATVLPLLLLVGCSGKGGGNSSSAATGETQVQEPINLVEDPYNMAVPVAPPSPTPIAGLPAAMQGRWGTVANDCNPADAAIAKGLMTIAGDQLSFYESRGTATRIRRDPRQGVLLDLPMSGEGQSWSEPTRLTLQDGGRTLVRQASGPHDRAGVYVYQRCPA